MTSNGKLDRKALPEVEVSQREGEKDYVAAFSLVQGQLVEMWEQVLGVQPIGIRDDFFELGGHSLKAARVISRAGPPPSWTHTSAVADRFQNHVLPFFSKNLCVEAGCH